MIDECENRGTIVAIEISARDVVALASAVKDAYVKYSEAQRCSSCSAESRERKREQYERLDRLFRSIERAKDQSSERES